MTLLTIICLIGFCGIFVLLMGFSETNRQEFKRLIELGNEIKTSTRDGVVQEVIDLRRELGVMVNDQQTLESEYNKLSNDARILQMKLDEMNGCGTTETKGEAA